MKVNKSYQLLKWGLLLEGGVWTLLSSLILVLAMMENNKNILAE